MSNNNELVLSRPVYTRLVQLFCSGLYTKKELSEILEVTTDTINKWLRKEEVANAINDYQREETELVNQALKANRLRAVNKLSELLEADNELVQYQAARDLLDRTGHKAMERIEVTHKSFEQQLDDIIANDVEYEDIEEDE